MISNWITDNFQKVVTIRRWLHQNPEIGFEEFKTSEYCRKLMTDFGFTINRNDKMGTGFYCDYGNSKGPTLAVRCDLDALPIQEINNIDYRSMNSGVSHACGHDAHMTNLLGLAHYVSETKLDLPGRLRFIFQPAEEIAPGGALSMIEGGAIDGVDHIIGGHVLPKLSSEKIGIKHGPMAATVELIDIRLKGPGGHTSRPAESVDLIWAQSHLVISLEESIKHHLDQREPVVLAFGRVKGGHAFNVLPDEVVLKGTLRYLHAELREKLHKIMDDTIHSVEQLTDARINWAVTHTSPGLTNDSQCTELIINAAKSVIGEENIYIMEEASMGGEDFAYYLEKIPGAYFRIGCFDGNTRDIHTPDFNIDEQCLATGIKVFAEAVKLYFSLSKS